MAGNDRNWTPSDETLIIMNKDSITPSELRDVIQECFIHAHGDEEQAMFILKEQSYKAGLFWDRPDKKGIIKLIPKLVEIAQDFRSPEVITANRIKIQGLLAKCSEKD